MLWIRIYYQVPQWIAQSSDLVDELDQNMMYVCVNATDHVAYVGETGRIFEIRCAEHHRHRRQKFGHDVVARRQLPHYRCLRARNVEMWIVFVPLVGYSVHRRRVLEDQIVTSWITLGNKPFV